MSVWDVFGAYIPISVSAVVHVVLISLATYGAVLAVGRMLELIVSDRGKNVFALIMMFGVSAFLVRVWDMEQVELGSWQVVGRIFFYAMGAVIVYVLFLWRMYSRTDALLDNRVGKDKFVPDEQKKEVNKKRRTTRKRK